MLVSYTFKLISPMVNEALSEKVTALADDTEVHLDNLEKLINNATTLSAEEINTKQIEIEREITKLMSEITNVEDLTETAQMRLSHLKVRLNV